MARKSPSITFFIIGLIWVSFFAGVFGLFLANTTTEYGTKEATIDLAIYNKMSELNTQVEKYRNQSKIEEEAGLTDIIGGYFSSGYQVISSTLNSFDIFSSLTNQAFSENDAFIPIGESLKQAIIVSVLILLILGVLVTVIVKQSGPI